MPKICFYLTTRGNYAKTKTIIDNLKVKVEIQYITGLDCPAMEFYGDMKRIGCDTPGAIANQVEQYLEEFQPDIFVIVADRWECLPAAMSAYYLNIPIAHLEGGEQSGAIDNRIRHAITQLANLHFPCSKEATNRIYDMGIEKGVFNVGATSFDMLLMYKDAPIDAKKPYLLVSFHPGSMEFEEIAWQIKGLLWAVQTIGIETYWIRPNIDIGNNIINAELDKIKWPFINVCSSMKIEKYAPLMANAACIVGNSSSGIRESSFLGVPAVNIGNRQVNRERSENVVDCEAVSYKIVAAIKERMACISFEPDYTYGDGHSGERVAEIMLKYLGLEVANVA